MILDLSLDVMSVFNFSMLKACPCLIAIRVLFHGWIGVMTGVASNCEIRRFTSTINSCSRRRPSTAVMVVSRSGGNVTNDGSNRFALYESRQTIVAISRRKSALSICGDKPFHPLRDSFFQTFKIDFFRREVFLNLLSHFAPLNIIV